MLSFQGGQIVLLAEVVAQLRAADVEGITLLGGEPLAHGAGAAALANAAHQLGLSVMVFSGYTLEEIRALPDPAASNLLAHTDILVDGPYLRELPEARRRWIGSSNQRVHFLTDRYRADDPCWQMPNTLEIRFQDGEVLVNGFPAQGFWKRL
jgi:anaerobic ribonucleoside-triphosphate reductase activating protein